MAILVTVEYAKTSQLKRFLFGSQIPVSTGRFELRISCIRWPKSLLWSLELVIQTIPEHGIIAVRSLAQSRNISTKMFQKQTEAILIYI